MFIKVTEKKLMYVHLNVFFFFFLVDQYINFKYNKEYLYRHVQLWWPDISNFWVQFLIPMIPY